MANTKTSGIKNRGFASMSVADRKEVAREGGIAAHAQGKAHEWTSDEARAAGRKGGMASRGGKGKLPAETPAAVVEPEQPF